MESGIRRIMDNDVLMKMGCDGMSSVVKSNLLMIESSLPSLLPQLLSWLNVKKQGHAPMIEVVAFLEETNPMDLSDDMKHCIYEATICRWLSHVAIYPNMELPWSKGPAPYSRLEFQHGDSFPSIWSIHSSHPSALLPYCSLELSAHELIIRYKDLSPRNPPRHINIGTIGTSQSGVELSSGQSVINISITV